MTKRYTAFFIVLLCFLSHPVYGALQSGPPQTGIDEKLGQYVPLDLAFTDEEGKSVLLKELVSRPTVVSLIYYTCSGACPALLSGLSEALDALELTPGKEFTVLTVSFDETDTPSTAAETKRNYLSGMHTQFPESEWKFLTGSSENIRKLTDSVGFRFARVRNGFLHPVSLIVLSPEGKVIRYLYGTSFLPRDLSMAVYEASQGRPGRTVGKLLLYCFSYDPQGKKYVFNILKVVGTVTILFVILFVVYLNISNKAYQKKRTDNGRE
ncbi:MAG TPA: SCO family protein [Nitrospiraceae bacterium]|nr:SCO family protein [Nitrospiraceae bacterium]